MPSLLHRNNSASNLEKPQPAHTHAHAHTAGNNQTTGMSDSTTVNGQANDAGGGKAFVHQRPTVSEWFKTYYVDLRE